MKQKAKILRIISSSEDMLVLIEDELRMHLEDLRDRGFFGRIKVTWDEGNEETGK